MSPHRGAEEPGATMCGVQQEEFEPAGMAAVFVLSESHVSVRTYAEQGSVFVDAFICGTRCDPHQNVNALPLALEPCGHITPRSWTGAAGFAFIRCAGSRSWADAGGRTGWTGRGLSGEFGGGGTAGEFAGEGAAQDVVVGAVPFQVSESLGQFAGGEALQRLAGPAREPPVRGGRRARS